MSDFSDFHDVRFPVAVSFGATGGPVRRNEIVALTSGREVRNARQALSRRRFDAGTGLRSVDDLYEIMSFFEARRGSLHAFRFRDPFDMSSTAPGNAIAASDQQLGIGDGDRTVFGLRKTYGEGADAHRRPITRPLAGTVRVALDGTELVPMEEFGIDAESGAVVLTAPPPEGTIVMAGFEFDIPARFDSDRLEASLASFRAGQIPTIPIIEVIE